LTGDTRLGACAVHRQFLEYLVDPLSQEPLRLENAETNGDLIEGGLLRSADREYPIVRGVPRFAGYASDHYAVSFGYQWKRWPRVQFESENAGRPMQGHTLRMWERITGISSDISQQVVLDIGCGPGRFIEVARRKGARVIGVDYSQAVEAAAENFAGDPDVCICQADALRLPIRQGSVDGAFSIGVLHHTPDPFRGVQAAYRAIRPGGWFAVSVYGKGGYYDFPTVQMWRRLFHFLWPLFGHYPPLLYSYITVYGLRPVAFIPLLGKAIRLFLPFVKLPDIRWSLLDTFDSVTPSYQSGHESHEVFQWLKRSGFVEVEPSDWGSTVFRGRKGGQGGRVVPG
jgi:SAM-dependent methyltransferase